MKTSWFLIAEFLRIVVALLTSSLRPKAISMARACAAALKLGTATASGSWRVFHFVTVTSLPAI